MNDVERREAASRKNSKWHFKFLMARKGEEKFTKTRIVFMQFSTLTSSSFFSSIARASERKLFDIHEKKKEEKKLVNYGSERQKQFIVPAVTRCSIFIPSSTSISFFTSCSRGKHT
jgi:hypothetical protein